MAKGRRMKARAAGSSGRDHVSFWFWFFALFVTAIPCIGWIMILVWAFWGDNASRKNYFRAIIAWAVLMFGLWIALAALGFWPLIQHAVQAHLPVKK
ncbi:MAG: hypothetical protein RLY20_413 [Verrucomicrobiota bacterium]|jgi:hypothetical protein